MFAHQFPSPILFQTVTKQVYYESVYLLPRRMQQVPRQFDRKNGNQPAVKILDTYSIGETDSTDSTDTNDAIKSLSKIQGSFM